MPATLSFDDFPPSMVDGERPSSSGSRRPSAVAGRHHLPRTKSSRSPMIDNIGARASDERSRSSGEDPNNILVDFDDRYHHIPATRDASSIPLVIVGTKCDLVGDREVSREMAIKCVADSPSYSLEITSGIC